MRGKYLVGLGLVFLIGCSSQANTPQKSTTNSVKETLLDKCKREKLACEAKCKIEYLTKEWKYKLCISKCYTFYGACKTGKVIKKGYEKTKELINK